MTMEHRHCWYPFSASPTEATDGVVRMGEDHNQCGGGKDSRTSTELGMSESVHIHSGELEKTGNLQAPMGAQFEEMK